MDQAAAKKTLQDLSKREDLKNKHCVDCGNPNPQWASVSFAIFICLQCAGTHRGFGVHISFVRSVSMDTWQHDQIKRMQLGGNDPFKQFLRSYTPADEGGYKDGMSSYDLYHCWAATQYRQKLDCEVAGRPWSPSNPPAGHATVPTRPTSAQGLRRSSATSRNPAGDTPSNNSFGISTQSSSDFSCADQKAANEAYFTALGQANASRPVDLPPSQGGRYQGFGNTPSPSRHPYLDSTSSVAPSLADFQENPAAALSKGWSIFSTAVAGASRALSETVIQPGMERVKDPNFQASIRGYVSEAQRRAQVAGQSANEWSKTQLGVDVADHMGGIVGSVRNKIGSGPQGSGYNSLTTQNPAETSGLYHDDTDDFFHEYSDATRSASQASTQRTLQPVGAQVSHKDDDWDDWKDF
ncbi:hypothetical protein EDC04DRAFT_631800 [Pisolithus marmoratus]|nr:hypothetical protein EDC04DRAFT_631800 [Pisolithus marmoratus]